MSKSAQFSLRVGAAVIASVTLAGSPAGAATAVHGKLTASKGAVVKVHKDWRDEDDRWERRHYRHRYNRDRDVVDAPFTRVETGRRVMVDAPFAHVYVGRHGRHVVAPFVNLWVPR